MTPYTLSTPEGRAEVRRLVEALPLPLDNTDGVVWTVDGQQIDDEGNYETWQVEVAATSPYFAPAFAAAPALLLAALKEIERLEKELSDERAHGAWMRRECEARVDAMHTATQDICEAAGVVTPKEPVDLMEALRQSLANAEEADKKRREER